MARIFVIEDELVLQKAICEGLQTLNFDVDGASDGKEALDKYFSNQYDLILLDLNLPKIDGIELLKEFRKDSLEVKIIILSARSEVKDKVLGLNLGSNDYLAKPFEFDELIARVNNLLLRDFVQLNSTIQYNEYTLNTVEKSLLYKETIISLSVTEYKIVEYLLKRQKRVVSNEQLIDAIWPDDERTKDKLKVHINNIRKKMPVNIINCKWGVGYYVE